MWLVIYWTIKITAWCGLIFGVFSITKPKTMLNLIIKSFQWKMKWFGLESQVRPRSQARTITRIWGIVISLLSAYLLYIFTYVIGITYMIK